MNEGRFSAAASLHSGRTDNCDRKKPVPCFTFAFSWSHYRETICEKVMRQRITRQRAVKTELSVPRSKMLRAHFSALIPLEARTDFHYRDIISLSTHMAKKICAVTRFLFISPLTHTATSLHLNLVTFCGGRLWNVTAVFVMYCIFGRRVKL